MYNYRIKKKTTTAGYELFVVQRQVRLFGWNLPMWKPYSDVDGLNGSYMDFTFFGEEVEYDTLKEAQDKIESFKRVDQACYNYKVVKEEILDD